MWDVYYTPASLDAALKLLAEHGARARVVAGGTDLLLEIERGLRKPEILIDITRLPGLGDVRLEGGSFHVGPLVTHNQVLGTPSLIAQAFPLAQACLEVGAPQIRNRGTLAGNLVTASPANDTIPALWALGATVTLASIRGLRTLTFDEFFQGVRRTALEADEMVLEVVFPALSGNSRGTFLKLGLRRSQAISVVNVAAVLKMVGEVVASASLAFGSVAPTIVRAVEAERYVQGKELTEETIRVACELAMAAARPIGDIRSPASYRAEMVGVLCARALRALRDGNERESWPTRLAFLWGAGGAQPPREVSNARVHRAQSRDVIALEVNGRAARIRGAADKTLLQMLREDLGLTGTKEGCGEGECGACTVFLDGKAVMACLVPAPAVDGREVVTIEGLSTGHIQIGTYGEGLHPVQRAFIQVDAIQCGYCTPGFIMAGAKLLEECQDPTRQQIEQSISGNLCRCTGYVNIVRAIELAAAGQT